MNASIISTNIYPNDPTQLQCFVLFSDGVTNITQSYTYPLDSDPLDQINTDLTNFNLAATALTTSVQDLQTALAATPIDNLSVAQPLLDSEVSLNISQNI